MKKLYFLLFVAIIATSQTVLAQETNFNPLDNPNEFYITYGDPGLVWGVGAMLGIGVSYAAVGLFSPLIGTQPSSTEINIKSIGVATLSYQHKFNKAKWFGLGAEFAYTYCKFKIKDKTTEENGSFHALIPMLNTNFYYFQRKHIEFYSGLSVGAAFLVDNKKTDVSFAGHINVFGLSAGGEHLRYHCELGVGMKGFVNMGIGYKF